MLSIHRLCLGVGRDGAEVQSTRTTIRFFMLNWLHSFPLVPPAAFFEIFFSCSLLPNKQVSVLAGNAKRQGTESWLQIPVLSMTCPLEPRHIDWLPAWQGRGPVPRGARGPGLAASPAAGEVVGLPDCQWIWAQSSLALFLAERFFFFLFHYWHILALMGTNKGQGTCWCQGSLELG